MKKEIKVLSFIALASIWAGVAAHSLAAALAVWFGLAAADEIASGRK